MRSYRVTINDRTYVANVEQTAADKLSITFNGAKFETELASKGEISTWIVRSDSKTVRTQAETHGDMIHVWQSGLPFSASIHPVPLGGLRTPASPAQGRQNSCQIRALMPGRVTSVIVRENDRVEAGSPLLILEAMKMQNEIAAPVGGQVKFIHVREGETVKKHSVLIEIGQ